MKKILLFAIVIITGCTTTIKNQTYKPEGSNNAWNITGELKSGSLTNTLHLKIDGESVINGSTVLIGGKSSLVGQYQGRRIDAICHVLKTGLYAYENYCIISIDNEKAVTLRF
jgi:hypothetical protein